MMTLSLLEDLKWQAGVTMVNVPLPPLSFPKGETAEVCAILHGDSTGFPKSFGLLFKSNYWKTGICLPCL